MGSARDIISDPYQTHRRPRLAHPSHRNSSCPRPEFMSSIENRPVSGVLWTGCEPIEEGVLCRSA
jgi:hypothetical protein